jgi:hypothetical protein
MAGPRDLSALRIDVGRLLGRLDELGQIGRIDGPNGEWGNARLALTDEDRAGRDLVVAWMRTWASTWHSTPSATSWPRGLAATRRWHR